MCFAFLQPRPFNACVFITILCFILDTAVPRLVLSEMGSAWCCLWASPGAHVGQLLAGAQPKIQGWAGEQGLRYCWWHNQDTLGAPSWCRGLLGKKSSNARWNFVCLLIKPQLGDHCARAEYGSTSRLQVNICHGDAVAMPNRLLFCRKAVLLVLCPV